MNLFSVKETKSQLKKYNLSPRKGLGQNFLIDEGVLHKIIRAADLTSEDIILEIGPGLGALTLELAKKAKRVAAIEKDEKLTKILNEILRAHNIENVEVTNDDILNLKLKIKNFKVVANLPYYITAPVIRKFIESEQKPGIMVLMVQKEVAQRITAKPPKMNLLAVSVQIYAKPEIISFVPKKSFWPEPKVDSAIIKLNIKKEESEIDRELFFKIVKAGFSQPRKQILNNFSKKLDLQKEKIIAWLSENKIKPESRAEALTLDDWIRLCQNF